MVRKRVSVCDVCNTSVSGKKCDCCKNDVCFDCHEVIEMGTIKVALCKNCEKKIERLIESDGDFWKEFNKQLDLKNKTMEYIGKKLILSSFDDKEVETDDDGWSKTNLAEAFKQGRFRTITRGAHGRLRKGGRSQRGDTLN